MRVIFIYSVFSVAIRESCYDQFFLYNTSWVIDRNLENSVKDIDCVSAVHVMNGKEFSTSKKCAMASRIFPKWKF